MEQSRLKLRISRMFRSSFVSCRTRTTSDVDEKALFASQPPHHHPLMTSPKPFPSICRPEPGRPDPTLRRRPRVSRRRGFSGENKPPSSSSGWCPSGDDDDEAETLFSSRTLSSDSTEPRRRRRRLRRRSREVGVEFSAGESFAAVVKRSSDPYGDFRASMVEMIVERQMLGEEDLENMLRCFLTLNSRHHHGIIVHVFTDIWEALFCDRS